MPHSLRRPLPHRLAILILFVAVGALTRTIVAGVPILNIDEASYAVGASALLHGGRPYVAFADNRPPLIYLYYALGQLIVGPAVVGVRWMTNLVIVPLTAFAASAFYWHEKRGIVAGLLYLVYGAAFLAGDMLAANCELIMMLPLATALMLLRDEQTARQPGRAFRVGLLIGVATLVKYQAALWIPPIAIVIAFVSDARPTVPATRSLGALLAGVAAPVVLTGLAFAAAGLWQDFFYWNVVENVIYVMNPTTARDALSLMTERLLPFLIVTGPLWVGWRLSIRLNTSRYWRALISGVVVASAVAAFLGLRFFPHYFIQLYVPLAVGAAPWIAEKLNRPLTAAGSFTIGYPAVALVGFTIANAYVYGRPIDSVSTQNSVFQNVADRLHADPCYKGATMFVWGHTAPLFYFRSGLAPASRLFFPEYPLVNYFAGNRRATSGQITLATPSRSWLSRWDAPGQQWTWLMSDLQQNQPTYFLDTATADLSDWQYFRLRDYPRLQQFVSDRYRVLTAVDGVVVYRHRDCADPTLPRLHDRVEHDAE